MTGGSEAALARKAVGHVRRRAAQGPPVVEAGRIALHFHPDFDLRGQPTLARMVADGRYLSQFVTGTSNGGLTARPGGGRWRWEQRIFGGVYDDADPWERPVYGALMLDQDPYGPAPRFGSAYLRLRRSAVHRSTFAYPDSVFEPRSFGVADQMGLEPMLTERPLEDPLDRYIEAHVHGGVTLRGDVEALVLDPCFAGTAVEQAARSSGLQVEWHPGYVLEPAPLIQHQGYRGADVVALAVRLAEEAALTPAVLGRARGRDEIDPQQLKQVWHYLARFGRTLTSP